MINTEIFATLFLTGVSLLLTYNLIYLFSTKLPGINITIIHIMRRQGQNERNERLENLPVRMHRENSTSSELSNITIESVWAIVDD